jgi:hypothetical protein
MQIKTTLKFLLEWLSRTQTTQMLARMYRKKEPSYTAGGNVNYYYHWKTVWRLLKKLKTELPYDPAILLLRIYLKECKSGYNKGTCTPMFVAVLFTIAKIWKQSRCSHTDEWIKKIWYLDTMEF